MRPSETVPRQEAVVSIVRAMRFVTPVPERDSSEILTDTAGYVDRKEAGESAMESWSAAIHTGLIKGYGSTLKSLQPVTRAEAATMILRMLQLTKLINS